MIRAKYILFIFILTVSLYANSITSNGLPISDQDYITGEDGVIRMNVNILGHVKNPGTYLVYDGIDFISLLSLAGGPARGANLKNIKIINNDSSYSINLIHRSKLILKLQFILKKKLVQKCSEVLI